MGLGFQNDLQCTLKKVHTVPANEGEADDAEARELSSGIAEEAAEEEAQSHVQSSNSLFLCKKKCFWHKE